MAIIDKKGGKLPAYMGDWSATYNDGHGYMVKNRVTIFGSELESLIDNNTYVPATRNEQTGVVTFDEHWKVISNGSQAYAAAIAATNKMAELEEEWDDQDQRMTQMQATINAKQLEVGAVQTDEVPTENSGNHMTSGDIYQTLKNSTKGFVDDEPTAGSDNLVKSSGVQNELALGAVYDVSAKNPTAGPNNDGKFESLSALLSDASLNALIPTAVRKGGMSIKFVQSSDNKYVQYRLMADEWSTTESDWSFCGNDVYVNNPEFIEVHNDAEHKVLYGVKEDGDFYFGAGVPSQVQEEIDALEEAKVDKVEGKGLSTNDYDNTAKAIVDTNELVENPEYLYVYIDKDRKVVEGLDKKGVKHIYSDTHIQGTVYAKAVKIKDSELNEINDIEGRIELSLDRFGRIISYRKPDGTKVECVGLETKKIKAESYEFPASFIDSLRKDIVIGQYNPAAWYRQGYTYEAKGSSKLMPLVYKIAGGAYIGVVSYPDGTLFYTTPSNAQDPGHIVRVNKDGTQETLLTVPGNIRMFDFLWFDSNYNLYVSPQQCDKDENNSNSGLYRLAYGADTFEHVLSLYDPNAENEEARVMNFDCIREVTEDFNGNLYAGVYGGNPPDRENPSIYKSTDGGLTWFHLVNLSYMAPGGKHIHAIEYNPYDNKLYCVVGEVNKLLRSADGGVTWEDCNCTLELGKGFAMCMVPDGILLGSDITYKSGLTKVYGDLTFKTVARTWFLAWPTFRVSDFTGWIYAFSRIDKGMTNNLNSFPPREGINDPAVLAAWKNGDYTSGTAPSNLAAWEEYNASVEPYSPENAIRPTQTAVLVSRDFGETWEILLRINESEYDNNTILSRSTGYFINGEMSFTVGSNTFVISEGKHKYTSNGVDCDGDVLIKLNGEITIVNPVY